MRSVYKLTAPRNPKAVKRTALIGIILGASVISLWLLLAWLGKTESNYREPEPGMRYGIPNEIKQTNSTPKVYQPSRFADGEVSIYKVRVEKGILTLPAGKVTFTADLLDTNSTKRWQFTLKGSAIGGLVKYDVTSIVNARFTHALEYHTVQTDLASRKVDLAFDEKARLCKRTLNGSPNGTVDTELITFDPLSIIFKFREMDLDRPGEFSSAVCDGKATFPAKVTVIGKEEIKIGKKTFKAILVEPDLGNLRGIFKKDPGAKLQIWLSDDSHRTALRIKTKIKYGTFIADLADYQRPEQEE